MFLVTIVLHILLFFFVPRIPCCLCIIKLC